MLAARGGMHGRNLHRRQYTPSPRSHASRQGQCSHGHHPRQFKPRLQIVFHVQVSRIQARKMSASPAMPPREITCSVSLIAYSRPELTILEEDFLQMRSMQQLDDQHPSSARARSR